MGVELWTVTAALIIATLEVSVFIKHDLWMDMHIHTSCSRCCCSWIFKSDNVCPPTFPTRSMFGPHTSFWAPFLYPTFTYTLLPTALVQIYICSVCGHTEMHCQGHHCCFICLSIYISTMADAAIVLKMLSFIQCLQWLTFWSVKARFQKQFIDPIKLSAVQLLQLHSCCEVGLWPHSNMVLALTRFEWRG